MDGVLKLYEPGSEGPQWWADWPDPVRRLPAAGILGRCDVTRGEGGALTTLEVRETRP